MFNALKNLVKKTQTPHINEDLNILLELIPENWDPDTMPKTIKTILDRQGYQRVLSIKLNGIINGEIYPLSVMAIFGNTEMLRYIITTYDIDINDDDNEYMRELTRTKIHLPKVLELVLELGLIINPINIPQLLHLSMTDPEKDRERINGCIEVMKKYVDRNDFTLVDLEGYNSLDWVVAVCCQGKSSEQYWETWHDNAVAIMIRCLINDFGLQLTQNFAKHKLLNGTSINVQFAELAVKEGLNLDVMVPDFEFVRKFNKVFVNLDGVQNTGVNPLTLWFIDHYKVDVHKKDGKTIMAQAFTAGNLELVEYLLVELGVMPIKEDFMQPIDSDLLELVYEHCGQGIEFDYEMLNRQYHIYSWRIMRGYISEDCEREDMCHIDALVDRLDQYRIAVNVRNGDESELSKIRHPCYSMKFEGDYSFETVIDELVCTFDIEELKYAIDNEIQFLVEPCQTRLTNIVTNRRKKA